jgi:hypothetical protein
VTRTSLLLVLVAASACPVALASPNDRPDGGRRARREARAEGGPGSGRALARHRHRRRARARLLRGLRATEAQRAVLREARLAAAGARRDLREATRAARREALAPGATPEARGALREKRAAALREATGKVAPHARKILDSLDSEQRARLLRAAERRGGEATDDEAARRIARRLLFGQGSRARAARAR